MSFEGHGVSKEETSTSLYIIYGSGITVSVFILQIIIVTLVVVNIKSRKQRHAEMYDRLDKEKLWSGKTTLDTSKNHYEDIPFEEGVDIGR